MKIANVLSILSTALTIAPEFLSLVKTTVKDVQTEFAGLPGTTKFTVAAARINSALDTATEDLTLVQDMKAAVAPMITMLVAGYNAIRAFPHAGQPADPAAAAAIALPPPQIIVNPPRATPPQP